MKKQESPGFSRGEHVNFCIRVDIDDTAPPCPAQCDTCKDAERPVWVKRPAYAPSMPAILHLVADVADKLAACGAYGTHERWLQSSAGVKCDACKLIEGTGQ